MQARNYWMLILLSGLLPAVAWAQVKQVTAQAPGSGTGFEIESTFQFQSLDDFALDATQFEHGQTPWSSARLRARWRHALSSTFQLQLGGALRANRLTGQGTEVGRLAHDQGLLDRRDSSAPTLALIPRYVQATWLTGLGRFVCGHQAVGWGMGVLVNDGAQPVDFGTGWRASLVERCAWGVRPFLGFRNFAVFSVADFIYQDENADYHAGDRAYGASAGFRYQTKSKTLALFTGYRSQKDRFDPSYPEAHHTGVEVVTTDLHTRWRWARWAGRRHTVWESEGALILGRTDRAYLEETYAHGARVVAMGGATRLGYESPEFTSRLELGYASGDNDPRDDVLRNFHFHSSYQVGMVLFDHVLPLVTARSADRLTDPGLLAVPPPSIRFTVARGGVTNAVYVYPFLSYRPLPPLDLRLGYVWAQSAADAVDVFQSAVNGGFNTTLGGVQTGGKTLGQEVDAAASYSLRNPLGQGMEFKLGGEFGLFLPGDAFAEVIDEAVVLARLSLQMAW